MQVGFGWENVKERYGIDEKKSAHFKIILFWNLLK
jgi:hypothetical protein